MNFGILDNPGNRYRPLKIEHGLCIDLDYAEKRLNTLKNKGYGGVVSNVAFEHYLADKDDLALFRNIVKKARVEGLRVWIYDEYGYPSGAAGGLTLKADPNYEAKAVAAVIKKVIPGQETTVNRLYGHDFLCAYAVPVDKDKDSCAYPSLCSKPEDVHIDAINGEIIDLRKYIDDNDTLSFHSDGHYLLCYFAVKRLYEGTHAVHNVFASRRYISVISKSAIKEFINNTYRKIH